MAVILLIENNAVMRPALCSLLENDGETVVTAMDVPGALAMSAHLPDVGLIVADVRMPQMDSVALVQCLRADVHYQTLPLLVFSTEGDDQLRQHVLQAGATNFLSAPFTVQELQKSVKKLLVSL